MRASFKTWRESASVILVAKTAYSPVIVSNDYNYKLLTLTRSQKAGILPGNQVFPGGNFCPADGSKDWLKLYERFGFGTSVFDRLDVRNNRPYPFDNTPTNEIPKCVSLRITAIRETFEESGILICRSFKQNYKERLARWASFISGPEILKWQQRVHQNPVAFLELCSQFEIYPDVWSLKQWSNWVTPPSIKGKFDTVFFLAAFQQTPPAVADKIEIQYIQWSTPSEYLLANSREEITLATPQLYEISRLSTFSDVSSLLRFAAERANQGTERYFPYVISTDKGMCMIFPGDDLYPIELDPTDHIVPYIPELPDTNVQHRMYNAGPKFEIVVKNYTPKCLHRIPILNKL